MLQASSLKQLLFGLSGELDPPMRAYDVYLSVDLLLHTE